MTIKEFDAKKNDLTYRETGGFKFEGNYYYNKAELNELKNFTLDPSNLVLDVGCGNGRITKEFAKSGAEIVAVDYSKNSLKVNRKSSGAHVIVADMCYLPFRPLIFDIIIALSVLQLIPTTESRFEALREVKRVMKHNSKFLLETYNYRPLYDGLIKHKKEGYFGRAVPPVYYYRFDHNELKQMLLSVFDEILEFRAILILLPLMQTLGNIKILREFAVFFEKIISKTCFSLFFADFLFVVCKKF